MATSSLHHHPRPNGDLEARIVALERDVAELKRARSTLSRVDRAALMLVLPAIVGQFGSEPFLTAEVIRRDDAGLELVLRGWSARRLGKLLKRGTDLVIDGYVVERVGLEAGAVLWSVKGVPEFPAV